MFNISNRRQERKLNTSGTNKKLIVRKRRHKAVFIFILDVIGVNSITNEKACQTG